MKTIQENFSSPNKEKQYFGYDNIPSFLMTPTKSEYKNKNETPIKSRRNLPTNQRIEKLIRAPIKSNINGHNYDFNNDDTINGDEECLRS